MKRLRKRNSRRGFVLVTSLLIVVLLSVVLLEFNYETRMNLHVSDNQYCSQQARSYADAGVDAAFARLSDWSTAKENGEEQLSDLFAEPLQLTLGESTVSVAIGNESGKINVNALVDPQGTINNEQVQLMLRLIDVLNADRSGQNQLSYGIVPAVIDWIDEDEDVCLLESVQRNNAGAEQNFYSGRNPEVMVKNAPVDDLDELLAVRGITAANFFGGETSNGDTIEGLQDSLTIYGKGKIDVNAAPAQILQSLAEGISPDQAQAVVERREESPIENKEDLQQAGEFTPSQMEQIVRLVTFEPQKKQYFTIKATADFRGFTKTVTTTVEQHNNRFHVLTRKES